MDEVIRPSPTPTSSICHIISHGCVEANCGHCDSETVGQILLSRCGADLSRPRRAFEIPDAPNIAGNPETYLVKSFNAFRKGERKNELMSLVVQPLNDRMSPISRATMRRSR